MLPEWIGTEEASLSAVQVLAVLHSTYLWLVDSVKGDINTISTKEVDQVQFSCHSQKYSAAVKELEKVKLELATTVLQ